MSRTLIGEKIFNNIDQENFLKLSLDYNQAHVFSKKKNQFKSKKTIVHGVNILLSAMEFFLSLKKKKIYNLNCNFFKPVFLNEKIKFYFYIENKENFIEVENNKKVVCAKIFMITNKPKNKNKIFSEKNYIKILRLKKTSNVDPLKFLNQVFMIKILNNKKFLTFPKTTKKYSSLFCDAMCAASYFIGMKCPGQKAIFTNINIDFEKFKRNFHYLMFSVHHYEEKIRLFSIKVNGFINMDLKSIYLK